MILGMKSFVFALFATCFLSFPALAAHVGDADRGKTIFRKCASCHAVGEGARNKVGPHLNGLFGRRAGSVEGARYSADMRRMGNDGLVWTSETLETYLENPRALVSKTRMSFRGLKDHADREDVLAYLRQFSDNPRDIPEAEPTATREVDLAPEILALEGDPAFGEYLAGECVTCHQAAGGDDGIPSITGWPVEDFVVALHAYRQKLRPHPVMQMVTSRLSDEEIAALASYFNGLN